ncbi:hypothetical protein [Bdellovibrio sp. HCB209]|uniref:hypothetical protein n=1 Tax=Bdellovibrio sp. HCB209 TaxID=3394354 RepID=UPI0039B3E66E
MNLAISLAMLLFGSLPMFGFAVLCILGIAAVFNPKLIAIPIIKGLALSFLSITSFTYILLAPTFIALQAMCNLSGLALHLSRADFIGPFWAPHVGMMFFSAYGALALITLFVLSDFSGLGILSILLEPVVAILAIAVSVVGLIAASFDGSLGASWQGFAIMAVVGITQLAWNKHSPSEQNFLGEGRNESFFKAAFGIGDSPAFSHQGKFADESELILATDYARRVISVIILLLPLSLFRIAPAGAKYSKDTFTNDVNRVVATVKEGSNCFADVSGRLIAITHTYKSVPLHLDLESKVFEIARTYCQRGVVK